MKKNNSKNICFILFHYHPETHRHWFHLYNFIDLLARDHNVLLIIERCEGKPSFRHLKNIRCLKRRNKFFRKLEMFFTLLRARLQGFRIFYNHYTFDAARQAALITRTLGGRTYLWHCIMVKDLDIFTDSGKLEQALFRLTLKMIHHLVTGTEFMARYYQKQFNLKPDKTVVVPNYINLERFNPDALDKEAVRRKLELPSDRHIILYLHEMEPGRCRYLPQVIKKTLELRKNVLFLLVGDGTYRQELLKKLQKFIDDGQVRYEGPVPNLKVPEYLKAADLLLITSDFEAFTRVILETMAMGVPFVSTDGGGGIPSYTPQEQHGYIVPLDQLGRMAELIDRLLENPGERRILAEAGLNKVREYDQSNVQKIFLEKIKDR